MSLKVPISLILCLVLTGPLCHHHPQGLGRLIPVWRSGVRGRNKVRGLTIARVSATHVETKTKNKRELTKIIDIPFFISLSTFLLWMIIQQLLSIHITVPLLPILETILKRESSERERETYKFGFDAVLERRKKREKAAAPLPLTLMIWLWQ